MKKAEILKAMRQNGSRFRMDDITIETGSTTFAGKGFLETDRESFRLTVLLADSGTIPPSITGYISSANFWVIKGLIEDEIYVKLCAAPSGTSHNHRFGREKRLSLEFWSSHLEVTPSGLDGLSNRERRELQTGKPEVVSAQPVPIYFLAILPKFKLIEHNGGTCTETKNDYLGESNSSSSDTFLGQLRDWNYGLIERDGDLHVHFDSKEDYRLTGDEDSVSFNAFLSALAFAHGKHAWPVSLQHWRDGKLILHRIHLRGEVARTPHAPFTETLAFGNAIGRYKWSFSDVLEKGHSFFVDRTRLSEECLNLQFLLREASAAGVPQRISLLTLCSLLESLIRAIYEEKVSPDEVNEVQSFLTAKAELLKDLRQQNRPKRLITILENAEPVNTRLRFEIVLNKLGLTAKPFWQDLYRLWSGFRNPLSHRMSSKSDSENDLKEATLAESQLAGAINLIVLKLMGYSGPVRLSAFEDKYTQI